MRSGNRMYDRICAIINKCHGWNTEVSKWVAK